MKRVLITGAGSYVGTRVLRRLQEESGKFCVQELDVKGEGWKNFDLSGLDSVFHVAGIAHVSADPSMEPLYMRVNRDLAIEMARRAKEVGVGQFVFMISSIVYGDSVPAGEGEPITPDTPPAPANFYGRSKLEAEEGLRALEGEGFSVVIRAPMIYGPGCKGNFPLLAKIVRMFPVFSALENRRSVLYVDNLAEFVAQIIDCEMGGLFFPQNSEYMSTSDAVAQLARAQGKKLHLSKALAPLAKFACGRIGAARKAFGSLYYDKSMSDYGFDYQVVGLEDSIDEFCRASGGAA